MALNANALTTTDAVKEYLKIDPAFTGDDSRLESLVNACSTAIESFCRRSFAQQTYTDEAYDGTGTRYLTLDNYPVQSVSSVSLNNQVLTPDQYVLKPKTGVLARTAPYPNTFTGLSISRFNSLWNLGDQNVLVTYTAGYASVPDDVELSCKVYVAAIFKADIAAFSTTFSDGFAFKADSMPVQAKLLLAPYIATDKGMA